MTWNLLKEWLKGRTGEPWFGFWNALAALCLLVLLFLFPLAVVATAAWGYYHGTAQPLSYVLKMAFRVGLVGAGFFIISLLGPCWSDLASERLGERRENITIQEIFRKTIDFERWCD
ncbi:hypothetical protein J2Z49_002618 [Desulfofundulus luciae]|uniref:Uncharacterized protein n=1 Tax=Desulfofundulus luciae TaxID=74702 RepID=A0ABU0B444_9FIRM|nr:hypothetical protein [Desulfofundulus luciae]MDQ0287490.1 hypothetical protein [Desulfofundulus luciae]